MALGIRGHMRLVRRQEACRARRRACLSLVAVAMLTLTLVLARPAVGSFSVFEDPRPGGYAIMLGKLEESPGGLQGEAAPQAQDGGAAPGGGPAEGDQGGGDGGEGDGEGSGGESEPAPQGEGGPRYHVVQPGESLSAIASRYGVSVSDLWIANRLINPHSLQPGQTLLIPAGPEDVFGDHAVAGDDDTAGGSGGRSPAGAVEEDPILHTVRSGENLWVIASRYGVTVNEIAEANRISASALIKPGQELEIPAGADPASGGTETGNAGSPSLTWPVYGTISSPFGPRNGGTHQGLDIAAPRGSYIRAAAAGRVKSTGWMGDYGYALIIDHGNGLSTLYAHCDKFLVGKGQQVTAGQHIALLGNTGRSTGPHVHFEVIVNGKRHDPLRYLLNL